MYQGPDKPTYYPTREHIAYAFGENIKKIDNWIRDGAPKRTKNGYPVREWKDWWLANQWKPPAVDAPNSPRERKFHFDAERSRLKYETEERRLIPEHEHNKALSDRDGWFSDVLNQFPGQLAPLVAGKGVADVKRTIRRACEEVRRLGFGDSGE